MRPFKLPPHAPVQPKIWDDHLAYVQPGQRIVHEGDLAIEGSVGEGAVLIVTGKLSIRNKVQDDVCIRAKTLQVKGFTGNNVTLDISGSMRLARVGSGLTARSCKNFSALSVGEDAYIRANDCTLQHYLDRWADIDVEGSFFSPNVGAKSVLKAIHGAKIGRLGAGCQLQSVHNVTIDETFEDCAFKVTHRLKIKLPHPKANYQGCQANRLHLGSPKKPARTFGRLLSRGRMQTLLPQ